MLDPDSYPDLDLMNLDPQHWTSKSGRVYSIVMSVIAVVWIAHCCQEDTDCLISVNNSQIVDNQREG